ncbi:MAG: hypothetical protein IJO29_06460 [Oscillospiraceae bacterium]|nr:hypothetical protein [Oscillospiraceae bacterium]
MKRTLKRAMASLTAAAIACTSMAVTSFAALTTGTDADGNYTATIDLATTGNWWDQVSITADELLGGSENAVQVVFESDDYAFSVGYNSVEVTGTDADGNDSYWYQPAAANRIVVDVAHIDYLDDPDNFAFNIGVSTDQIIDGQVSWTVYSEEVEAPVEPEEPEEPTTPDGVVGFTNSIDIEATGSYWDQVSIGKADLMGDINAYHVVAIVFESEDAFGIGYNSTETGSWYQATGSKCYQASDIDYFMDAQYFSMSFIGQIGSGTTTISWTVYVTEQLIGDLTEADGKVEFGSDEVRALNLYEVGTYNPADITSVIFNVTMTDSGWGWANAQVYTNTDEWRQVSIGGADAGCDVTLEEGVATDIEVDFISDYWYQVGAVCYNGTFDINSITFMAGDEVYYTMEVLPLAEKLNGTSASIEDGVIGLNFFMSFGEEVLADEGAMLYITFADGTTEAWTISDGEETENGYKYPVYVDAKEMADDVTIQVAMSDGTVGKEYTQSVKAYANEILSAEAGTYTDETIALVKAMLVYGGYAQEYFGYNTENLASEGLDTDVSSATVNKIFAKYKEGTLPEGVEYIGSALVLNGTTKIRHFFTATDVSQLPEGYLQQGDYYYYQIENIYADGLGGMYTTTIGEWSIEYSALSYARAVINNSDNYSEELVNLVKAMVKLYEAAKAV